MSKLSAATVKNASRRGYYSDGGGLYLQVGSTGAKSWVFRYKVRGKLHEMGLGALHTVGLAEARTRARQCREHRLDGLDPLAVRKATQMQAMLDAAKGMTSRNAQKATSRRTRPAGATASIGTSGRQIMDAWAKFCAAAPTTGGKVVSFAAAKQASLAASQPYRRLMDLANKTRENDETVEQAFARLYADPNTRISSRPRKRIGKTHEGHEQFQVRVVKYFNMLI